MNNLVFVDCEATGACPAVGRLTEFGAVLFSDKSFFYGDLRGVPAAAETMQGVFADFSAWLAASVKGRPIFVSDNPAFDWQWINDGFWRTLGRNPFGHSARRISDFYAGLRGDFRKTQEWKQWRKTPHTHNPVDDAMGNVEAFQKMLEELNAGAKDSL